MRQTNKTEARALTFKAQAAQIDVLHSALLCFVFFVKNAPSRCQEAFRLVSTYMSLRHRAPVVVTRVPDEDVVEAAERLRARHLSSNGLFRRLFVLLAVALACARLALAYYGATAPHGLPHHSEARLVFGPLFWLLELLGVGDATF